MEIKFIKKDDTTEFQQKMIDIVNKICFDFDPNELKTDEGHMFGAIEYGAYVLLNQADIVGIIYIYKRRSEYDGQEFYLGGFGGLGILPDYRHKGYARQLVEKAIQMSYEIGIDIACLFIERNETVYKLYEKLGYTFLNRDAYYIDSLGKEKVIRDVMILGLNNKPLAQKILSTNYKFHYGKDEGCW